LEARPRELVEYLTEDGRNPFQDWLEDLRDIQGRAMVRKRLNRVRLGNLGAHRSVGEGVQELKVDFGPGYRVYFGEDGHKIVVLLCGGDKGSQETDIRRAKEYWKDYRS
jgi:putative addiction module killer protein